MSIKQIVVPDIGGAKDAAIIEVAVKPGDRLEQEAAMITLESEKASIDIPAPMSGVVKEVLVKVGDKVSEGSAILMLEIAEDKQAEPKAETPVVKEKVELQAAAPSSAKETELQPIVLPDVGSDKAVPIIEIHIQVGQQIALEDALITLESEKASIDVPSPLAGQVEKVAVKIGDKIKQGDIIAYLKTAANVQKNSAINTISESQTVVTANEAVQIPASPETKSMLAQEQTQTVTASAGLAHAGPSVRRLAFQLGVDIAKVAATGRKGRVLPEDLHAYVKKTMQNLAQGGATSGTGLNLLPWPTVDFAKFGTVEVQPLSRIKKISGSNLHRNWVMIPHITQFEEADITELEEFRQKSKQDAEKAGAKLTPLVFIMKAVVAALKMYPQFNASLDASGENLVLKKYFHIGVAVDTPNGLVVPVIRDVDQKSLLQLSQELAVVSKKAREGKLMPTDMQGGCFSISSLGGIGGTAFTPIVNAPEVAILGVSRSDIKPKYIEHEFKPRLMLPLSLSYDHRVIDGADAARFVTYLANCLSDIRKLLL